MKKIFFLLTVLFALPLCFAGVKQQDEKRLSNREFYIPESAEIGFTIKALDYLRAWEAGRISVSDDDFAKIYEDHIGAKNFSSMIYEQFFRNTNNSAIKAQIKNYIAKSKRNGEYEKALLKKIDAKKKVIKTADHEAIQYSYNDTEFDENINLFDFYEARPFKDEFGMLLFDNKWEILQWKNRADDSDVSGKKLLLMCGGGTNALTISIKESENVKTEKELEAVFNRKYFEEKYPDNWEFSELKKKGVLEQSGADRYFVCFGSGPDITSEISSATAIAYLYSKKHSKVYSMSIFINFSKINMNYAIREQVFEYIRFFTLFCYIDSKV